MIRERLQLLRESLALSALTLALMLLAGCATPRQCPAPLAVYPADPRVPMVEGGHVLYPAADGCNWIVDGHVMTSVLCGVPPGCRWIMDGDYVVGQKCEPKGMKP